MVKDGYGNEVCWACSIFCLDRKGKILKVNIWWIQTRSATRFNDRVNTSLGVLNPSRFLGWLFNCSWIILSSSSVTVDTALFLGMYCRSNPLKFSFDPLYQLAKGSAKYVVDLRAASMRWCSANSFPLSKVIVFTKGAKGLSLVKMAALTRSEVLLMTWARTA